MANITPQADSRASANIRLSSLRRFLAAEPDNARLRRDVVDTAIAAGEFQYLKEFAESRLAKAPDDAEAQFDRATAFLGLQDYPAALDALKPLDATIPGVRFNTGVALFMLSRYPEARPYFQAGYDAGERSAPLLRTFIRTLHHLGEMDAAVGIANGNAAAVVKDAELAGSCALLFIDAGNAADGARCAQISLAANPNNIDALVSAASISSLELDVARGRAAYDRVVEIQPANGRAWLGLGLLSMTEMNFPLAIEQLEKGLRAMPLHVGSWHALGWARLYGGDIDKADAAFMQALELNRNFSETHGCLAVIAAMRGQRADAERYIAVAERLDRNGLTAKYARTLLASSPDEGRQMLVDLLKGIPGHGPKLAELIRKSRP
jgi:tetratricopeptide (TPR) repeat protein